MDSVGFSAAMKEVGTHEIRIDEASIEITGVGHCILAVVVLTERVEAFEDIISSLLLKLRWR